MSKIIETSISVDYVRSWGEWEGLRELIQNTIDGTEGKISYRNEQLVLVNKDTFLPLSVLLLGETTKASNVNKIGQFGEGMKLGLLALVRLGISVTIENGPDTWTPIIVKSSTFGKNILAFKIEEKGNPRNKTFRVHIDIEKDRWEEYSGLILKDRSARVLRGKKQRGKIFVKGIWVCDMSEALYGYNFTNVTTNRDRSMLSNFDQLWAIAQIWAQDGNLSDIMKLAQSDSPEATYLKSFIAPDKVKEIAERFIKKNPKATPVVDSEQSKAFAKLGQASVVVSRKLYDLLETEMGTFDTKRDALVNASIEIVPPNGKQAAVLADALDLLKGDYIVQIVRFGDDQIVTRTVDNELYISVDEVTSVSRTLAALALEVSRQASPATPERRLKGILRDIVSTLLKE